MPLGTFVHRQNTVRKRRVVAHVIRPVVHIATTQIHHTQLVLPCLRHIDGVDGDLHLAVGRGSERCRVKERWFAYRAHRLYCHSIFAAGLERHRQHSRRHRGAGSIAYRKRLKPVLVPGLQVQHELVAVAGQTKLGRSLRQGHRVGAGEVQLHWAIGVFVRRVASTHLNPVGARGARTVDQAGVIGARIRRPEGRRSRAIGGLQTVTHRKLAPGRVHHFHQNAAQARPVGRRRGHRKHLASGGTELEPIRVNVGRNANRVHGPRAKRAVTPLNVAVHGHIARQRSCACQGVAVVVWGARHQGIAARIGLAIGGLDHQVVGAAGNGLERQPGLMGNQPVVNRLQQRAVSGPNFEHRVKQGAVAALRRPHAQHIGFLPK